MAKPCLGVVCGDGPERFSDGLVESFGGAGFGLAQVLFELGPRLLDGIEVGRVGWQVNQLRTAGFYFLRNSGNLVSTEIVQHNDIAGLKDRAQHLFHIGGEDFSVRSCLDGHRSFHSA